MNVQQMIRVSITREDDFQDFVYFKLLQMFILNISNPHGSKQAARCQNLTFFFLFFLSNFH